MGTISLTARDALTITTNLGLPYRQFKADILDGLLHARAQHCAPRSDGRVKTAEDYFTAWMAELAFVSQCEGREAERFDADH